MSDSRSIARISRAIRSRDERPAGVASVSPKALGAREGQRDVPPAKFRRTGKAELNDGAKTSVVLPNGAAPKGGPVPAVADGP